MAKTNPKIEKCVNCGIEMSKSWRGVQTLKGRVCMACEFKNVQVIKVSHAGSFLVTEEAAEALSVVEDILKDSYFDTGDSVTVEVITMRVTEYHNMPEFQGL